MAITVQDCMIILDSYMLKEYICKHTNKNNLEHTCTEGEYMLDFKLVELIFGINITNKQG